MLTSTSGQLDCDGFRRCGSSYGCSHGAQEAATGHAKSRSAEAANEHPTEGTAAGGLLPLPQRKRRALCESSPSHYIAGCTGAVRKGMEALLAAALDRCAAAGWMQPKAPGPWEAEQCCLSPEVAPRADSALYATRPDSTPAAKRGPLVAGDLESQMSASPSLRVGADPKAGLKQITIAPTVELEQAAAEGSSPSSMRRVSATFAMYRPIPFTQWCKKWQPMQQIRAIVNSCELCRSASICRTSLGRQRAARTACQASGSAACLRCRGWGPSYTGLRAPCMCLHLHKLTYMHSPCLSCFCACADPCLAAAAHGAAMRCAIGLLAQALAPSPAVPAACCASGQADSC